MYLNTKENEERYNALKAKYQGEVYRRRFLVQRAECKVEVWQETLKGIEKEWEDFHATKFNGTFTAEKGARQYDISCRMSSARRKLDSAKKELAQLHADLNNVSFGNNNLKHNDYGNKV